jgi:hypothetical protein
MFEITPRSEWRRYILFTGPRYVEIETALLEILDAAHNPMMLNLTVRHQNNMSPSGDKHPMRRRTPDGDELRAKHSRDMSGKNNPMYGKKHTRETKAIISEKRAGRPLSPEHRQAISDYWTLNGHPRSMLGKTHTEEWKERASERTIFRRRKPDVRDPRGRCALLRANRREAPDVRETPHGRVSVKNL